MLGLRPSGAALCVSSAAAVPEGRGIVPTGHPSDPSAELRARERALSDAGRGQAVARQHERGRLTARERLDLLLDPDSLVELGMHVRHRSRDFGLAEREIPGDAVVTGFGTVHGRTVYVFAQDFSALGGTVGEMHAEKIVRVQRLALEAGVPLIGINDSGGARIQEGIDALHGYARIFRQNTMASGVIPQISVVLGPSAGGAVYSPALTDFVFMVEGISQMYITGPDVVRSVLGQEVSHEDLGGGGVHASTSGVCHFLAADERSCLAAVRELLTYLPANNLEDPPLCAPTEPAGDGARLEAVLPRDPRGSYDVRAVVDGLVDAGSFREVQAHWAQNAVVGLGRIEGRPVGVVANQPRVLAGCLDIHSSDKIARFVRTCDAFNLPLVTLVDTPGYLPGVDQEHGGIIRHGAKVLYAYAEATVPKVSLVLRKAYGGAYIAMCSRGLGGDLTAAWPTAEIAVMGPEGACNIVYREEIARAPDPTEARARRVAEYREAFANPYVAAGRALVDAVIAPEATRSWVASALRAAGTKRQELPGRKHGNLPV